MKLSIIVPVYNVEKYLSKCLDSLLHQDLPKEQYEVIVVNDGSTDNSEIIAQQYADNYSNIILVNQQNKGLSGARNTGIQNANGKYIQFVDSDDYLQSNILSTLLDKIEREDLDILRFDYQNVNEVGDVIHPNKDPKRHTDYSDSVTSGSDFLANRLGYACYACMFIIKTDLLKQNSIYFVEGILFEDTEWTPRLLHYAQRVNSTTLITYNYLLRGGSITQPKTEEQKNKIIESRIELIKRMVEQNGLHPNEWYDNYISFACISILQNIVHCGKWKYIKSLLKMKFLPIKINMDNRLRMRIYALSVNISPYLFCCLYYIISKIRAIK